MGRRHKAKCGLEPDVFALGQYDGMRWRIIPDRGRRDKRRKSSMAGFHNTTSQRHRHDSQVERKGTWRLDAEIVAGNGTEGRESG